MAGPIYFDPSRVQPSTVQDRATSPASPAGVSGTVVLSGYVEDGERNPLLAGSNRYITFSNTLLNTAIVAAGTRYFLNLLSKPSWTLEPPKGVEGAELYAEKIERMIYGSQALDTPWHRVVRRGGTYRFYGFSIQEWTARRMADGTIGLGDVAARPQSTIERWDRDEHGQVYGVVQRSPSTGRDIYLPRWKTVYVVDDSISDSPEGVGLFRHIAESVRRLKVYEQLEGWGFETDLRGIPVGRAPVAALDALVKDGTITEAQKTAALSGMRGFLKGHVRRPDTAILLDSITYEDRDTQRPSAQRKWDLELLKAESTAMPDVLRAIERLNREIARVLGVEQLLLGDNGVGSFAMAKEKNHNFAAVINGTLTELSEVYLRDLVRPIFLMNGWPLEAMPELRVDRLAFQDVEAVTSALERMSRAGATVLPDDPAVSQVRRMVGLSDPTTIPSAEDAGLLPGKLERESAEAAQAAAEAAAESDPKTDGSPDDQ